MKATSTQSISDRTPVTFERILVCGSPQQDAPILLEQALPFMKSGDAPVRLLELPERQHPPHAPRPEPLARVIESLSRLGVVVQRERAPASFDAILKAVATGEYDLVIKGVALSEYGRRTLDPLDQQLVERCPCPVWLAEWAAPRPITRVLAAVDPGTREDQRDAAETRRKALASRIATTAAEFANLAGAELHVLHTWNVFGDPLLRGLFSAERFEAYLNETRELASRALQETLARAQVSAQPDRVHLLKGNFEEMAPRVITDFDVDLAVLGTRGRASWLGPIVQPHAESLLCNTRASVVVLKAP